MENSRMGFLINYKVREAYEYNDLRDLSDNIKAVCSQEKLIELLQKKLSYSVVSVQKINITEYLLNHEDEVIKVLD